MQYGEGYFKKTGGSQRQLQLARLAEVLVEEFRPSSAVDVGCGEGFLVHHLRRLGVASFGVDVSDYALSLAPTEVRPHLFCLDLQTDSLPLAPASVDLVTALEVLEHLRNPSQAIVEIGRVLRPGGHAFITTPLPLADSKLGQLFLGRGWRRLDPTHVNVHGRAFWRKSFERQGFRYQGTFPGYYRDISANYWLSRLLNGLPLGEHLRAFLAGSCLFELGE